MPTSYASIPVEIWEECLCRLAPRDLYSVIFVCRVLADVGLLLLYRSIIFKSDQKHIMHTISLLRQRPTIAVKISKAVLTTVPPMRESASWIPPDFFIHSVNLRYLELRGFPFSRPEDQVIFNDTLRKHCTKLSSFTYRPGETEFPKDALRLLGLKTFRWQSSLASAEFKVAMLQGSVETLTRVSFEGMVVHVTGKPYDEFLRLRFPNLAYLELGSLTQTNIQTPGGANRIITEFILAHRLIEHLSLGRKRSHEDINTFFQFREDLLHTDSIPHLKHFEGFPENVSAMARRHLSSLFSITSLTLSCAGEVIRPAFVQIYNDMFNAVRNVSRLEEVKRLGLNFDLPLGHTMDSSSIPIIPLQLMNQFSDLCPNVTCWHGALFTMQAESFSTMFKSYEHVEEIFLPELSLMSLRHSSPSVAFAFLSPIACTCRNLKRVFALKPRYTESEYKDTIYRLNRNDANNHELQSVDIETVQDIQSADLHA